MRHLFLLTLFFILPFLSLEKGYSQEESSKPTSVHFIHNEEAEKKFIERSHEVIEGEEHERFFADFKESLNFKKKLIEGNRWISMNSQTSVRDIVLDSVMLFGMTHSLEMLSGPTMVAVGYINHWPEWLVTALGLAGATVSIPGLDPLCIIAFITYSRSSKFRKVIRKVRFAAVKGLKFAGDLTGITASLKRIFTKEVMQQILAEQRSLKSIKALSAKSEKYEYFFEYQQSWLRLQIIREGNRAYVHQSEAKVSPTHPFLVEDQVLLSLSKKLRLKTWIKEVLQRASQELESEKPFYIEKVSKKEKDHIFIQLEKNAISLNPKWIFKSRKNAMNRCILALQAIQ